MEDFFDFLFYLFCAYAAVKILEMIVADHLEKKLEAHNEFRSRINEIIHRVNIEQHAETYYWFDMDDGEFLGQGKNTEEIIVVLKQRFPEHIFLLPTHQKIHAPSWTPEPYTVQNLSKSFDK